MAVYFHFPSPTFRVTVVFYFYVYYKPQIYYYSFYFEQLIIFK